MSWELPVLMVPGFTAAASLTTKQFYFVKITAAGQVNVCTALTDIPVGVLQNKPASGSPAVIMAIGISKVSSDAALSVTNLIGPSADSQADARTAGGSPDNTHYVVGQVIVASGAAAGYAVALINCASPARAA